MFLLFVFYYIGHRYIEYGHGFNLTNKNITAYCILMLIWSSV